MATGTNASVHVKRAQGTSGNTGAASGRELLDTLKKLGAGGTLMLEGHDEQALYLFEDGELRSRNAAEREQLLDSTGLGFYFRPHSERSRPSLQSRFADGATAALRALPYVGAGTVLPAHLFNIEVLFSHLRQEGFSGSLSTCSEEHSGVVLVLEGRVGFVSAEEQGRVRTQEAGLRSIYGQCLTDHRTLLELKPLPQSWVASLIGLGFELRIELESSQAFSGIEAHENGYTFFEDGAELFTVEGRLLGKAGFFTPCRQVPSLDLPDEPPGWERRRFRLTLRGKDALNPMTTLAMQLREQMGWQGGEVLAELSAGRSLEEVGLNMGLELSELKPWLSKLEKEGYIRIDEN